MLPNWGFRNTVHAYHAENPIELPLKSSNDCASGNSVVSLDKFVEKNIPEIKDGARHYLKPTLFTGTLQTLHTFKGDFHTKYPVYFAREIVSLSHEEAKELKGTFKHIHAGEFTLDYLVNPPSEELNDEYFSRKCKETMPEGYPRLHPRCRYYAPNELAQLKNEWKQDNSPISIILPGLAGGIQEAPIRATCYKLQQKGHRVVVLNQRGCSRSKITTPHMFTGLDTDDLKYILHKFHDEYELDDEKRQFHAIGYSFGGLQIANYLIKEGKNTLLTSAITVSSPWNLYNSMLHISNSWSGRYLFEPAVNSFLLRMVKNNKEVLKENPIFSQERYDHLRKTMKNSRDFDDAYTSKLLDLPSGDYYYYAASPVFQIYKIETPLLVINSIDDPMISPDYPFLDISRHPWIYMATADLGGHYSFIKPNGDFWFSEVVEKWINSWREVDVQTPSDVLDHGWHVDVELPLRE